jgi:hypothetical protein
MLLKPFLGIFGIAALLSGLMCPAGFAATRITSLSVTATVAAGCQISPASAADTGAKSGKSNWNTPISMSCSLPVAYQIIVSSRALADRSAVKSRYDPIRFVSRSLTQDHAEAMRRIADDDGSEVMTVTIIY